MAVVTPVREAWAEALYGADGFFMRAAPVDHFRTSATASPLFAEAIAELALRCEVDTVWDIGAGRGELLGELARLNPGWSLHGVELAPAPSGLDASIGWHTRMPESVRGLVIANELLDDVPCTVAEIDEHGMPRVVAVDLETGEQTLTDPLDDADTAWMNRWWPGAESGRRIEIGLDRDEAWSDVVSCVAEGVAVAIDYGHDAGSRPPYGSMRSYREGRMVDTVWDGGADITADVALDSVAAAVDGYVVRQRAALQTLGLDGTRPSTQLATDDPQRYLALLARAGEAGELTSSPGLGDFGWVVRGVGVHVPL